MAPLKSFVKYDGQSQFPLENLPWGIFSTAKDPSPRAGLALGDSIIDLKQLSSHPTILDSDESPLSAAQAQHLFTQPTLNAYIALERSTQSSFRSFVQRLFSEGDDRLATDDEWKAKILVDAKEATLHLPISVGDYTDFCASKEHTDNTGRILFGEGNVLEDNWFSLPIGYHGRSSSIVVSGTDVKRPKGISVPPNSNQPVYGPCKVLDYELELAFVVGGPSTKLGETVDLKDASMHVFGAVLMNDWSARDIQKWEMKPLGPFLGKNFATSISPWIVEIEALEPFKTAAPEQVPRPLPHLDEAGKGTNYDIKLFAEIRATSPTKDGAAEAEEEEGWTLTTNTNAKYLYWTMSQMLTHHTSGGCNINAGDLLASGTISAPYDLPDPTACLLEKTRGGRKPFTLDGEGEVKRTFIEDGDEVRIRGLCSRPELGYLVGFGEVKGKVVA
ncbi:fumarylacetoacetase [Violaceomyces palustris]|uniref:Fumarylacetoacetase n=1 Tax=Violaceomyces palustris TaxID=1673888 RepID=A0ACD0NN95_9BASI|nr:fumarylacetoacetase [Violaceomyces palustris]